MFRARNKIGQRSEKSPEKWRNSGKFAASFASVRSGKLRSRPAMRLVSIAAPGLRCAARNR
jgi:hypothetical protein